MAKGQGQWGKFQYQCPNKTQDYKNKDLLDGGLPQREPQHNSDVSISMRHA